MRHLLIATSNAGKVREFREMLGGERFAWDDLSRHPSFTPVAETGRTFAANACRKAAGYAAQFDTWALADDSGLEVDALGGSPGVHSARWAELNGTGRGDAQHGNGPSKVSVTVSPRFAALLTAVVNRCRS